MVWAHGAKDDWKGLHTEICVHYTMSQMPQRRWPDLAINTLAVFRVQDVDAGLSGSCETQ